MTTPAEFDHQRLEQLRQLGGNGLIVKLVNLFGEFARDRVRDALDASGRGDLHAVGLAAHAIRSSASNVGATRLYDIATAMECAAREGTAAVVPGLATELKAAFDTTLAYLRTTIREAA